MTFNLLYVAVVIFSLLIVGLVLTVMDFRETERAAKLAVDKKPPVDNLAGMAVDHTL